MSAIELSVIVPIYNEQDNIPLLYRSLKEALGTMNLSSEIIFVNDGSRDGSLEILRSLAISDHTVKFINFSRNFGHQIAVSAGLDHCTGKTAVIIDADMQDPPALIPKLYSKLQEGYEVVYAKRRSREGDSFLKKATAKIFYRLLSRITTVDIPVDTGDFRIIDRKIINILKQMPEQQKFLRGQISWIGYRQTFIEYDRAERFAGETGYTYKKMIRLALDGITSFSRFPLKFATFSGFIVSGLAFLLIIYTLFAKFIFNQAQPGWASIMLAVLFIGGIQLIGIGIIGEYIGRLSDNVRNRPLYVVQESNIDEPKKNPLEMLESQSSYDL
jgi:glycosyltransferase involved in cell wall biosynthesis